MGGTRVRRGRVGLAFVLAVGMTAASALATTAASPDVHRAYGRALIAPEGSSEPIGWIRLDVRQSVAGGPISGYYEFDGLPGQDLLRVRAVIETSLWWSVDISGNFEAGAFSGTECLYYADHTECRPFIHVAQDWIDPRAPDWISWEVPGVSWQNFHAVKGEINVQLAE